MTPFSFFKTCSFLLLSSLFIFACKTTEKASATPDAFSDAYYQNMGSNLERLQMLQAGLFVQYRKGRKDSEFSVWAFNDSEDSMMLYVTPVGDPNKDGYWLYGHQFISNLPNAPVFTSFIKIESLSRDTFVARYYKSPQVYSWDKVKKNEMNNVVFSSLETSGELIYFTKVSNSHFDGLSDLYKNPVVGQDNYRQDTYTLKPNGIIFQAKRYADLVKRDDVEVGEAQYLLRLKKSSSPFLK